MRKILMKKQAGFTLIELIMVIVILSFLGVVAIPLYVDLRTEARAANEQGVVAGIRAGLLTYFVDPARGNRTSYPGDLDPGITTWPTTCDTTNACFTGVLTQGGVTDGNWSKLSAATYRSPASTTNVWTYTPGTGNFQKTTN